MYKHLGGDVWVISGTFVVMYAMVDTTQLHAAPAAMQPATIRIALQKHVSAWHICSCSELLAEA